MCLHKLFISPSLSSGWIKGIISFGFQLSGGDISPECTIEDVCVCQGFGLRKGCCEPFEKDTGSDSTAGAAPLSSKTRGAL